ncbi:hypothetical protein CC80DRAFT_195492 [Byssothecium circinans]|uniref:Uncharacterized protein n=1 Tax=Byssothecium circinans TaxID=147558 RepID=A0A6A5UD36_9PLEO|nr:hypothetical protein CC80DRAFT_195492 [Byssothecium circinans]
MMRRNECGAGSRSTTQSCCACDHIYLDLATVSDEREKQPPKFFRGNQVKTRSRQPRTAYRYF